MRDLDTFVFCILKINIFIYIKYLKILNKILSHDQIFKEIKLLLNATP